MASIVITTQPEGATDVLGVVDTVLSVTPEAEQGTITYQWKVGTLSDGSDLEDIVDATEAAYTIPVDSAIGTKYYACLLHTDGALDDTLTDVVAVIIVAASIKITDQPDSQIIASATLPAALKVVATYDGADVLAYQWYSCTDAEKAGAKLLADEVTDTHDPGEQRPGYPTYFFCRLSASDVETDVDTQVATIQQTGLLPVIPTRITGAFVNAYIYQCSAKVQERFAALKVFRGIAIENNDVPLRTKQIELFMDAI